MVSDLSPRPPLWGLKGPTVRGRGGLLKPLLDDGDSRGEVPESLPEMGGPSLFWNGRPQDALPRQVKEVSPETLRLESSLRRRSGSPWVLLDVSSSSFCPVWSALPRAFVDQTSKSEMGKCQVCQSGPLSVERDMVQKFRQFETGRL